MLTLSSPESKSSPSTSKFSGSLQSSPVVPPLGSQSTLFLNLLFGVPHVSSLAVPAPLQVPVASLTSWTTPAHTHTPKIRLIYSKIL